MNILNVFCRCQRVKLEVTGPPSTATICYCAECQTASIIFQNRYGHPTAGADGGTIHALWRKDRVRCVEGAEHLAGHRLAPNSPTKRVIATCCGAPMYLDRAGRPWVGIFIDRLPGEARPLPQMGVYAKDRVDPKQKSIEFRAYAGYSKRLHMRRWRAILRSRFATGHLGFVTRDM